MAFALIGCGGVEPALNISTPSNNAYGFIDFDKITDFADALIKDMTELFHDVIAFDESRDYGIAAAAGIGSVVVLATIFGGGNNGNSGATATNTSLAPIDVPININEPPRFATDTATATADENATAIAYTPNASDANANDSIAYSLASTGDFDLFNITPAGVLTFKTAPDYESPPSSKTTYNLTIIARDNGGLQDQQTLTVTLQNVNEAPTIGAGVIASADTREVVENSRTSAVFYTAAQATDIDANDSLTYSVAGADGDYFTINANREVTFKDTPDHEAVTDGIYTFKVRATDAAGLYADTADTITVTVTNINEQAVFAMAAAPTGGLFADRLSDDPEGNGAFTYQWQKSSDGGTSWTDISGASDKAIYVPASDDAHIRLLQITYTDAANTDETITLANNAFAIRHPVNNDARGTNGSDYIAGDAGNDIFRALGGDDIVYGGAGNDTFIGGAGNDILYGGAGNDVLDGGTGADTLYGGDGIDRARYWDTPSNGEGVTVNLATGKGSGGWAEGDRFFGIENIWGTDHSDVLIGDDGANVIWGVSGGPDIMRGGGGDDRIISFDGQDTLDGGAGHDVLDYNTDDANTTGVTVNLATGIGSGGFAEGDRFSNFETVWGNQAKADTLIGDDNANTLRGFGGADTLRGGGGDDIIEGGAGADILEGGAGNDTFFMDLIANTRATDVVTDFTNGDKLRIYTKIASADFDNLSDADTLADLATGETLGWIKNNSSNTRTGNGSADDTVFFIDLDNDDALDNGETVVMILEDYNSDLVFGNFDIVYLSA